MNSFSYVLQLRTELNGAINEKYDDRIRIILQQAERKERRGHIFGLRQGVRERGRERSAGRSYISVLSLSVSSLLRRTDTQRQIKMY